jgi:hypothetical protein
VIEPVVPESPTAEGTLLRSHNNNRRATNNEDKDNEEYSPLSNKEGEKMYRDADEVESFGAETPVPTDRLQALLVYLGITTAPRYRIKEVPRPGRVEFKATIEIFSGS